MLRTHNCLLNMPSVIIVYNQISNGFGLLKIEIDRRPEWLTFRSKTTNRYYSPITVFDSIDLFRFQHDMRRFVIINVIVLIYIP